MENTEKKKSTASKNIRLELFIYFLVLCIITLVLWPFITVTIEGGFVGVYYSRFFGGTDVERTLHEGLQYKLPWDKIITYDARTQSRSYTVTALAQGGLNIDVDISVVWFIDKDKAGILHKNMGPDYADKIIEPALISTVRSAIGSNQQGSLYDGNPIQIQNKVLELLSEQFREVPFKIHAVLIKRIKLPEDMAAAISQKFVAEQNVLEERYNVLKSLETFKKNYINSESANVTQTIINSGLTENYLRYLGIQATLSLAQSDNSKLVIIGDKDGLPLILNSDTLTESNTIKAGTQAQIDKRDPEDRAQNLIDAVNNLKAGVNITEETMEKLLKIFPELTEGLDLSSIKQSNSVETEAGSASTGSRNADTNARVNVDPDGP